MASKLKSLLGSTRRRVASVRNETPPVNNDLSNNGPFPVKKDASLLKYYASPFSDASPFNDPPPAYMMDLGSAPAAPAPPAPPLASTSSAGGDGDKLAFLSKFDTIFLIDDSCSMNGKSGGKHSGSRWHEVEEVLRAVAPTCTQRDQDGIDIYFINHTSSQISPDMAPGGYYNVRNDADVLTIFQMVGNAYGRTYTGARLETILRPYMERVRSAAKSSSGFDSLKPLNVIVITDGEADDDPAGVLVNIAKELNDCNAPAAQLGVQFFQVGSDPSAREALRGLDDDLEKHAGRDIVDAVTWDGEGYELSRDGILKVVLGSVSRRLDWKPMAGRR